MSDADAAAPEVHPLDPADPRFGRDGPAAVRTPRRLVPGRGPMPDPDDPRLRVLRVALPAVFFAAVVAVALVFFSGLRPGPQSQAIGPESAVRSAVAERPRRVCFNDNNPCAWITVVDDRLLAFNTNGPLAQEYGRAGVAWCPTSQWFGANSTGSRFDQRGRVARGPAPRGLDRFGVRTDAAGIVHIDFTELTAGTPAGLTTEVTPPAGAHCDTIAFDRDADLPDLLPGS